MQPAPEAQIDSININGCYFRLTPAGGVGLKSDHEKRKSNPAGSAEASPGHSIAGLLLLAAGLFMVRDLLHPASERILPEQLGSLLFMSPVVAVLGGALLLLGLFRFATGHGRSRSVGSTQARKRAGQVWRITIWMTVICTVFPWWWLSLLTRLSGGRPGNESEGMGGTLIMLFIGFPALALAIFNEARLILNRHQQK